MSKLVKRLERFTSTLPDAHHSATQQGQPLIAAVMREIQRRQRELMRSVEVQPTDDVQTLSSPQAVSEGESVTTVHVVRPIKQ